MQDRELIPTRWSLLERLKDWGDDTSWKEFFDTYWRLIYGVAIKAGLTDAEAQEVVQETVLTVAKKMPDFKADPAFGSFKSWLLNTTRWKIGNQFGKRLPTEHHKDEPDGEPRTDTVERIPDPGYFNLDVIWNDEWQNNILEIALDRVKKRTPSKQCQIYYLHVIKNRPATEVAKTLGVNLGQIYLAKHRVSVLLKKEIKKLESKLV